ncbi:MAG: hypothetical protein ACM3ZB_03670 [bacterium]|jgi:hypothetical protein
MDGNTEHSPDVRAIVRETIEEFLKREQARTEPAHKAELMEERKRREVLERRVNELEEENRRARQAAEEAERVSVIRTELQRLGVAKVDVAFKAVRDDIVRAEDGRLIARTEHGEVSVRDYLTSFVHENPEFLPARIAGGSGATGSQRPAEGGGADLEKIRPGMSAEEADRIRQEIIRVAGQTNRGA